MFKKVLEARIIASDFLELLEISLGKNISGAESVTKESVSPFSEIVTIQRNGLTHEIQFRKDEDKINLNASLNSYYYQNKVMAYVNKNINMDFHEDGKKTLIVKSSKGNCNDRWVIKLEIDEFNRVKDVQIDRTKRKKISDSTGKGLNLISILRTLNKKYIENRIKLQSHSERSMC